MKEKHMCPTIITCQWMRVIIHIELRRTNFSVRASEFVVCRKVLVCWNSVKACKPEPSTVENAGRREMKHSMRFMFAMWGSTDIQMIWHLQQSNNDCQKTCSFQWGTDFSIGEGVVVGAGRRAEGVLTLSHRWSMRKSTPVSWWPLLLRHGAEEVPGHHQR